jgi:hypothetical protein
MSHHISSAAHICREVVYLIYVTSGFDAVVPPSEIEELELISGGVHVPGFLRIHTPDPAAVASQALHQMMANEAAGSGDQNAWV